MGDHTWASEEESREQFHAETFPPSGGAHEPSLTQLRARALELSNFTPREIRSMTRAELVRLIENNDPRD
jgi:hypothetical protein